MTEKASLLSMPELARMDRRRFLKSFAFAGASATLARGALARLPLGGSAAGDGVTISGGAVTINRLAGGFGAKSQAAPAYYSNFDSATVGVFPTAGGLIGSQDGTPVAVTNTLSWSGTQSLQATYTHGADRFPEISFLTTGATQQFITARIYWACTSGALSGSPLLKLCRAGSNSNGGLYHGRPQFYMTGRPSGTAIQGGDWGYVDDNGEVAWSQQMFQGITPFNGPSAGVWNYMRHRFALSTPGGAANGLCEMFCNNNDLFPTPVVDQNTGAALTYGITRDTGSTATADWIIPFIDGLGSAGTNDLTLCVDNLYMDTTLQGLIMGSASTLATSTVQSTCIPTAWNDNQIVATLETTGFTSGQSVWFFPFGAAGNQVAIYSSVLP